MHLQAGICRPQTLVPTMSHICHVSAISLPASCLSTSKLLTMSLPAADGASVHGLDNALYMKGCKAEACCTANDPAGPGHALQSSSCRHAAGRWCNVGMVGAVKAWMPFIPCAWVPHKMHAQGVAFKISGMTYTTCTHDETSWPVIPSQSVTEGSQCSAAVASRGQQRSAHSEPHDLF